MKYEGDHCRDVRTHANAQGMCVELFEFGRHGRGFRMFTQTRFKGPSKEKDRRHPESKHNFSETAFPQRRPKDCFKEHAPKMTTKPNSSKMATSNDCM